jgi:hypothetical protein
MGLAILGSQLLDLTTFIIAATVIPNAMQYELNPTIRVALALGGIPAVVALKLGIGLFGAVSGNYAVRHGGRVARTLLIGGVLFTVLAAMLNVVSVVVLMN